MNEWQKKLMKGTHKGEEERRRKKKKT